MKRDAGRTESLTSHKDHELGAIAALIVMHRSKRHAIRCQRLLRTYAPD